METSFFFAKLLGGILFLMGSSMLLRPKIAMTVFREIAAQRAFSYLLGTLLITFGLTIVITHNVWEVGFPLAITLIGWDLLIEGTLCLFFSQTLVEKYFGPLQKQSVLLSIALVQLLLGTYLLFAGFSIL